MNYIDEFKDYLASNYYSKRTVDTYIYFINDFNNFLNDNGIDITEFEPYHIIEYIKYKSKIKRKKIGKDTYTIIHENRNDDLSTFTENTIKASIISFIKFMASMGNKRFKSMAIETTIGTIDILKIKTRKMIRKQKPKSIPLNDIKKILDIYSDKPEYYSGLVILFWTGARPVELTEKLYYALNDSVIDGVKCYVDFENQKFKIETAKRVDPYRFRVIPWCDEINEYMYDWCNFIKRKHGKVKSDYFHRLLDTITKSRRKKIIESIGYSISPKYARYTVETELRNVIQQHYVNYWLGHKLPKYVIDVDGRKVDVSHGISATMVVYTDPERTCEQLREKLIYNGKHFMLNII